MSLIFTTLHHFDEMVPQLELIRQLYPDYSEEIYQTMLKEMIPHNYHQLLVTKDQQKIGMLGYWLNTKLWSGRYLEIDHFIIKPNFRSNGIGNQMVNYIQKIAQDHQCKMITLDCYTTNFEAQKFFFNQGFIPKGFHFIKSL